LFGLAILIDIYIPPFEKRKVLAKYLAVTLIAVYAIGTLSMVSAQTQGSITSQNAQNQRTRVGIHDTQTSPEGARGGSVTDPTLCSQTTASNCKSTVKPNCFGKVIQHRAQEHKENPDELTLGAHTRDPVPELPGRETPRQGIGNQDQGHPAAHGAFNSQFDPDDEANVIANC
jgi:hypothetical protein